MKKTPLLNKKKLDSPSTFLNPVPVVMVSCCGTTSSFDKPNIITVGWVGTVNSEPPMLSISVRKSRHSHQQILESGEFVVNLVTESLLEACDFCGVKSGRDIDKFSACHLIPEKNVDILRFAPAIQNSPVSLFCKVTKVLELPSHDLFIGEIVAVTVAEDLYETSGKINLERARLVVFSHGEYWSLQEVLGFFGYSVASSEVKARRMPKKGLSKESKLRKRPGKGRQ